MSKSDWPEAIHSMFQDFLIVAAIITVVALLLFQGPSCCHQLSAVKQDNYNHADSRRIEQAARAERERTDNE